MKVLNSSISEKLLEYLTRFLSIRIYSKWITLD